MRYLIFISLLLLGDPPDTLKTDTVKQEIQIRGEQADADLDSIKIYLKELLNEKADTLIVPAD